MVSGNPCNSCVADGDDPACGVGGSRAAFVAQPYRGTLLIRTPPPPLGPPQGPRQGATLGRYGLRLLESEIPLYRGASNLSASNLQYRGISPIRKRNPLGPFSRTMPGILGGSYGGGQFLVIEVPPVGPSRSFLTGTAQPPHRMNFRIEIAD